MCDEPSIEDPSGLCLSYATDGVCIEHKGLCAIGSDGFDCVERKGGAIWNGGWMTLRSSILERNVVSADNELGYGGGDTPCAGHDNDVACRASRVSCHAAGYARGEW